MTNIHDITSRLPAPLTTSVDVACSRRTITPESAEKNEWAEDELLFERVNLTLGELLENSFQGVEVRRTSPNSLTLVDADESPSPSDGSLELYHYIVIGTIRQLNTLEHELERQRLGA